MGKRRPTNFVNLIDSEPFYRLTVKKYAGDSHWWCKCSCGRKELVRVQSSKLRSGSTKSCGCYRQEHTTTVKTKHGQAAGNRTAAYRVWCNIKDRCLNTRYRDYPSYGGRGIRMDEVWAASFEAFFLDMGPRPGPGYSIDRKENNGDYVASNCRWATRSTQDRNRRSNVPVTFKEQTMILKDWATLLGIRYAKLWRRLRKDGWSVEKAFTTP